MSIDNQFFDIDGDGDIDMEVGVIEDHTFVHLIPDVGNQSVGIFDPNGEIVAYAEDTDDNGEFSEDEWINPDGSSPVETYQPASENVEQVGQDSEEASPNNVTQVAPEHYEPSPQDPADVDVPYIPQADPEPVQPESENLVAVIEGRAIDFGPATEDTDSDLRADTAVAEGDGFVYVATDDDGDHRVDVLKVFDAQSGEQVTIVEADERGNLVLEDQPDTVTTESTGVAPEEIGLAPVTTGAVPEPTGEDLVVDLPDGPVNLGPANVDSDGNGTLDTAMLSVAGQTTVATDIDGDGIPDEVKVFNDTTNELVARIVRVDGEWQSVGEGVQPDEAGQFVVPADYAGQSNPVQQLLADAAVDFWQAAYPGSPWPSDSDGPYDPLILLAAIGNDESLQQTDPSLTQSAAEIVASYQSMARTWTEQGND